MKKQILFCIILLLSINTKVVEAQISDDISTKVEIKNLYKVDDGIYRCSQPSKEQFELLEEGGIKEILNLRRHNSDDDKAKDTNLKLHHVKMRAEAINEKHLLQAMRIIKEREGDILIHCHHGSDRTGAMVAMYRIVFQNWTKEDAIKELTDGGYGFHKVFRNIPKLIDKINIEAFKKKLFEEAYSPLPLQEKSDY